MMRRYLTWAALLLLIAAGVAVGKWQSAATMRGDDGPVDAAREAGWDALVGNPPPKQYVKWEGYTVKPMAKTTINSVKYTASYDFIFHYEGSTDQAGVQSIGGGYAVFTYAGNGNGYAYFQFLADPADTFYMRIPEAGEGVVECGYSYVSESDKSQILMTVTANPIGDKQATHAKEIALEESWEDVPGAQTIVTMTPIGVAEFGAEPPGMATWTPYTSRTLTRPTNLTNMAFAGEFDPDDWSAIGKYAAYFDNVAYCGNTCDLSAFTARNFGGVSDLWVEGTADGKLGFWGESHAMTYHGWGPTTVYPPYSYDFSGLRIKWMDGVEVADALELFVTGIRTLNEAGEDIGPWSGTYGELKALGRYTQKYGLFDEDPFEPDCQALCSVYLDRTSAESLGIEVGLGTPDFKVEGSGYGLTIVGGEPVPGPVDGDYCADGRTYNGNPVYANSNGYALFCTEEASNSWGIGPDPAVPPYYVQADGGPGGAYLANCPPYTDTYDEATTLWSFGGASQGLGPAVSTATGFAVLDGSAASFGHDLLLILDCWPLSATSRTASPYMTDVVSLAHDDSKSVLASAHTVEDWAPSAGATAPTSAGAFTVSAAPATLTLELASNYIARQGLVGGVDEIPVPTAYLMRRHDSQLGEGATPEPNEAVYDWRGWGYLHQSFILPGDLPQTVTCEISYYNDLGGIGDNHKSDSTRQTEYTYSPGDLYTLTREATIIYRDAVTGYSTMVVDLLTDKPLALVTQIKFTFAAAGSYTMGDTYLHVDSGDRNEVSATDPFYRTAPATHGAEVKLFEAWRYAQGGLSGHYDGVFDRALYVPDNAKGNAIEFCFPYLSVVIGAGTGEDLTTTYLLAGWPVTDGGDAWTLTYSAAAEAAHMVDADDVGLKTLNCYDLVPSMHRSIETSGALPVAVRCGQITCVRGLPYTFYGTHYVGGQVHGRALLTDGEDDRARSRTVETIQRREIADPANAWGFFQSGIGSDAHGHYTSKGGAIVARYATHRARLYEYGRRDTSYGRMATREFLAIDLLVTVPAGNPFLCLDAHGFPVWLVNESDGNINCYRVDGQFGNELYPVTPPFTDGNHTWASVAHNNCGWVFVAATNTVTGNMDIAVSHKGGMTWEAPVATLGAGLQYGTIWSDNGQIKIAGWADGKVYFASASNPTTLARDVLTGAATTLEVATAAAAAGVIPRSSGCVDSTRKDIVAVGGAVNTDLYGCTNYKNGFSLITDA